MSSSRVTASCHCGAVHLEIDSAPETVTDCNCSICRRYGALWAYYPIEHVRIVAGPDTTDAYRWGERTTEFRRCKSCGCVTHWESVGGVDPRVGVNARLLEPAVLAAARVRRLDGADTWKYLDEPDDSPEVP